MSSFAALALAPRPDSDVVVVGGVLVLVPAIDVLVGRGVLVGSGVLVLVPTIDVLVGRGVFVIVPAIDVLVGSGVLARSRTCFCTHNTVGTRRRSHTRCCCS